MIRTLLSGLLALGWALPAFAWTEGELLVWISSNKGYNGLAEVGQRFEKDRGVKVTVEHSDRFVDRLRSASQNGGGPDILLWAHDRIGEWVDAGLLRPLTIGDDLRRSFIPMAWDAVNYKGQTYGYPLALEAVSLIYNKKFVTGPPPAQLDELPAFSKQLNAKDPNLIAVMWDYGAPYFNWPFLASAGGYPFRKTLTGYDTGDIGIDNPGAVKGLTAVVSLINAGVLPKGASYSLMEQTMNAGDLAVMISGPWAWAGLRKSGIDFGVAPLPGVDGKPARPFVGVFAAMISHATPNADLATQFVEKYVATADGLKTIDADVPLGVPALLSAYEELASKDPLVRTTYENAQHGEVMPNIPQMAKFWSALRTALQIATNGQASPAAALADAKQAMEK